MHFDSYASFYFHFLMLLIFFVGQTQGRETNIQHTNVRLQHVNLTRITYCTIRTSQLRALQGTPYFVGMEAHSLSSVPSSSRLKGALRWSQAEDAAARINVVKAQVDAAARGSLLRGDLAKGLSELDSIRQFLNEGVNLSNQEHLKGGAKDQLLHAALEKGLSDLESVKANLIAALNNQTHEGRRERAPSAHAKPTAPAPPPRAPSGSNFSQQRRSMFGGAVGGEQTPTATAMRPGPTTSRPMSAPVRKESVPSKPTPFSAAQGGSKGGPTKPAPPSAAPSANGTTTSSHGGEWGKYQDWAQNVLNRVQSRKMQQKKNGLFRGAHDEAGDAKHPSDQYEDEIASDDGEDGDDDGGEEDGLGRSDRVSPRYGRPPQPTFSSGIPRARPLSATFGRSQSGSSTSIPVPTSLNGGKTVRPESANFTQQRSSSQSQPAAHAQQQQPAKPSTLRNRPATAGMSVRSEVPPGGAGQGKLHPQAQALREQGNIYFQQKKYKESAEAYGKAISQYEPQSETLYCNRAAAYLMMNRCEEALADAQAAIALDPSHVKAHWRAAKACLYLGRSDMAKQLYDAAHKLAEVQTETDAISAEMKAVDLAEKCRRCLRLREYTEALRAADNLLEIFPINGPCSAPWVCLKGETLLHTDAHEAGALLTNLCTEDPTNAEAWLIRGKALFYSAHDAISTTTALGYLNKARDLDVGKASVVVVNGSGGGTQSFVNTVAGRSATLINVIESFSKLRDAGNNAYAAGKWAEAHDAYTRCLNVDPCNNSLKAIILCNRAAVSIQCEKWKEAMDDVNASIANNSTNAKAFTRRARIHQHNGDYDDAVRDLQTAVQMYPSAENQERLQQALEQQRAHQRAQQQRSANAAHSNAQAKAGSYRFFGTTHDGFRMPRPNTAGARSHSHHTGGGSSYSSFFSRNASGAGTAHSSYNSYGSNANSVPKPSAPNTTRYYQILSINKLADDKTITKAYREAALKWHPDKWASGTAEQKQQAEDTFKEINIAYSVLRDATKRKQYDMGVAVS